MRVRVKKRGEENNGGTKEKDQNLVLGRNEKEKGGNARVVSQETPFVFKKGTKYTVKVKKRKGKPTAQRGKEKKRRTRGQRGKLISGKNEDRGALGGLKSKGKKRKLAKTAEREERNPPNEKEKKKSKSPPNSEGKRQRDQDKRKRAKCLIKKRKIKKKKKSQKATQLRCHR